jgi:DNA-binding MarR family transcriptional regulator
MSKTSARVSSRAQLLTALDEAIRKLGAQAVLVSELVAARVGLNCTDLECLDLLHLAGPTTAGQVSAHSGLTTGATTAVIDRLESAGFVKRRRDPHDRRVVLVEVLDNCLPEVAPLYRSLQEDLTKVNARYTNHDLDVVARYMTEANEALARHVEWLQTQPAATERRRRHGSSSESFGQPAGVGRSASARSVRKSQNARRHRLPREGQEQSRRPVRRK